jgi:mannose-1-phosphate guanylyltransferase/mannose-6-phosphate isomerase
VKRIIVKPGAAVAADAPPPRRALGRRVRARRASRAASRTFLLEENQSTYIPLGTKHRLENPGKSRCTLIEVQSGAYLGEDDIVRFEDVYGRERNQ